jgi:hypothetical protein
MTAAFAMAAMLCAVPAFRAVVVCGVYGSPIDCQKRAAAARARFWATYPDNLMLNQYPQNSSLPRRAGQGAVADLFDRYVSGIKLDNGIPRSAQPEFFEWPEAFRKNLAAAVCCKVGTKIGADSW